MICSLHPYLLSTDHKRFLIHSCLLPAIADCLNCDVLMIITVFLIQCHDCIFLCDYFWDVVMIQFLSLEPIFVPQMRSVASQFPAIIVFIIVCKATMISEQHFYSGDIPSVMLPYSLTALSPDCIVTR